MNIQERVRKWCSSTPIPRLIPSETIRWKFTLGTGCRLSMSDEIQLGVSFPCRCLWRWQHGLILTWTIKQITSEAVKTKKMFQRSNRSGQSTHLWRCSNTVFARCHFGVNISEQSHLPLISSPEQTTEYMWKTRQYYSGNGWSYTVARACISPPFPLFFFHLFFFIFNCFIYLFLSLFITLLPRSQHEI